MATKGHRMLIFIPKDLSSGFIYGIAGAPTSPTAQSTECNVPWCCESASAFKPLHGADKGSSYVSNMQFTRKLRLSIWKELRYTKDL